MRRLRTGQVRFILGLAAAAASVALVLLGLRVAGTITRTPAIPLMLLVAAIGIVSSVAAGRRQSTTPDRAE